jgi:predicted TIM-barrel fold metal-dependent hydrolase
MITEYPLEDRRYDGSEYEPFWAAAAALDLPLSLHTATRRQGKIRGAGDKTLRDASSRATKAFYPALSLCDLIFSGVFERIPASPWPSWSSSWHGRPTCSRRWTTPTASATARRFTGLRACPREGGDGMLPSDFFRGNVVLSSQEDAIGIRLRDAIGVDNMMWASDYPHSGSTFPQSRKILAEILAGVPDDKQAKIAGGNTARVYNFDVARRTVPA